jgi:PAS domain S-box-containing protein
MVTDLSTFKHVFSAIEASSILSITDKQGIITYVNDLFCEKSQYNRDELIGVNHRVVNSGFHPRSHFDALWAAITKDQVWRGEMLNRAKDGSDYWLSLTIVPLKNEQEIDEQFLAIGTDITERKQSELTLMQIMQKLHDIDHALDESSIVAITDDKGVITYVNDKFCVISKYPREELLGRTHRVINSGYHPKSFFKEMWDTIKQGKVWKGEVKNRAKDGSDYWMNTTIVPYLNDHGIPHQYISIRTDITDRVKAEAELGDRTNQLAKAHAEAIQANRVKSQFLANMSHELRTPLNAIIGYSEMLREEAEELGEPIFVQDLGKISKAGNHLLALINDILDISKIESGKTDLHLETFQLRDLVQDVMSTMEPLILAGGNQITMQFNVEGDITIDVMKLRQILINLLSNANKFTENGRIAFDVHRESRMDRSGFSFRVQDTGIGMSAQQLERIFAPFTQADSTTTRKYGGTGLGLAISQRYSQMLGGDITVESTLGVGSIFICWLPESHDHLIESIS